MRRFRTVSATLTLPLVGSYFSPVRDVLRWPQQSPRLEIRSITINENPRRR